MKRFLLLLAVALGATAAHAQLVLSDFSNFTPDAYSQSFPVDATSWSSLTAQSGPTSFTIGDFGSGAPSGALGNGFYQFLATPADWSGYTTVTLTGLTAPANATPYLYFQVQDENFSSAVTAFALTDFSGGTATVTVPLSLDGIDATQITSWAFVVEEFDNPQFGFTFDKVELATATAAVPEPATYAALLGAAVLLGAVVRRVRR